jgi:transcription-repair coupling factor (superfamily II helicase)
MGIIFPNMDKYINYIYETDTSFLDYFKKEDVIFLDQPAQIINSLKSVQYEYNETCMSLMEKGAVLPSTLDIIFDFEKIKRNVLKYKTVIFEKFNNKSEYFFPSERYKILANSTPAYYGNFNLLFEDIRNWKSKNNKILILAGTKGKSNRIKELLEEENIYAKYIETYNEELKNGEVYISNGSLSKGIEYPESNFVIVGDKELFGEAKKSRKKFKNIKGKKINIFTDLKVGDYVVHHSHGIGIYEGIMQLNVENIKKDYFKINYVGGDTLYVPTEQMDLIQKFIGGEGKKPKLHKLGGSDWSKTKTKVKAALMEIAGELVKLYAKRKEIKGYPFSKDTVWQKEMEDLFPFDETEDQLKCIEEIKNDMESNSSMDRLLCGDVGFGKTEVAIRAIFKAVMDGKQVAYLVPTTVLAEQQYKSLKERMKDFPVTIASLNRFRTKNEQMEITKDLKKGMIDIVVGTHRLVQKDVEFKDLGLLVVDEEQRFGVRHKERIKQIKNNVDVLTLTATPIPRTLHMSLVGIRDISVIEDPPENRQPIQTYVMEHSLDIIKDAIEREVARKGQVFYLYNSVKTIDIKEAELTNLLPHIRISVAHGQMNEKELEERMQSFIDGEIDCLICTTIIESGLDMGNVNTIIVEDGDKMGLSQLYQLRGRVGRSNKLAYAYITYKKNKIISEVAEKRLTALREFNELGSGFKIAMRDLEIRGSGNLLGAQQHGQIDSVGYDMYCTLLDRAVKELQGEPIKDEKDIDVTIDFKISGYISDDYVQSEVEKIDLYKRISSVEDENDIMELTDELIDRFGDIPNEVVVLMNISAIRHLAKACNFDNITEKGDNILLQYPSEKEVDMRVISALIKEYNRDILFSASKKPYFTYKNRENKPLVMLHNIKSLLQYIKKSLEE